MCSARGISLILLVIAAMASLRPGPASANDNGPPSGFARTCPEPGLPAYLDGLKKDIEQAKTEPSSPPVSSGAPSVQPMSVAVDSGGSGAQSARQTAGSYSGAGTSGVDRLGPTSGAGIPSSARPSIRRDAAALEGLITVAEGTNKAGVEAISQFERRKLIKELEERAAKLAREANEKEAEAVAVLTQKARVRAAILKGANDPVVVTNFDFKDGIATMDARSFNVNERPDLRIKEVPVRTTFPAGYDSNLPLAPVVERNGSYLAEPVQGASRDLHFTGDVDSHPNPVPEERYHLKNPGKPFRTPAPVPVEKLKIPIGTAAERLAQVLEPGEHATLLGEGGMNAVYITHPKPPPEVLAGGRKKLLDWAKKNQIDVIRVAKDHTLIQEIARRDHAMKSASKDLSKRLTFDGKPLFEVVENTNTEHQALGITRTPLLKGKTAYEIQKYLDHYFSAACNEHCKSSMRDLFQNEGMYKPEEMSARLGALEQGYRDTYFESVRFAEGMGVISIGNQSKVAVDGGADFAYMIQGLDYNHGHNHSWDPAKMMFSEFDAR